MKLNQLGSNQTEIQLGNNQILFSYNTPVAEYNILTKNMFKTNKFWSKTTSRHINKYIQLKNPISISDISQDELDCWDDQDTFNDLGV